MKKLLSILLIFVLCMGLVTMTGCGKSEELANPYEGMDLSEYITLPDYNQYSLTKPVAAEISDADIDAEIQALLESCMTTEDVKEGIVEEGDYLLVDYKGTLADGSTQDGMSSEGVTMGPLGNAGYIPGFEDGLVGAAVGDTVVLDLQFPDPYHNAELSGQDVTFEVTIHAKKVDVLPELTDDFIAANTDQKTVEEYRAYVKEQLEISDYDSKVYDLQNELYMQIVEETELIAYPEGMVKAEIEKLTADYQEIADTYGYENWDDFRDDYFQMEQAEYEEQLKLYAESLVKGSMVIYAVAEKEGLTMTEELYTEKLNEMLELAGFASDDDFKAYTGMTIREYADAYNMDKDLLLTDCLDAIYERLAK